MKIGEIRTLSGPMEQRLAEARKIVARTELKPSPKAIVEGLDPANSSSRIPIISVTGTNGKTTITRMIARMIAATGKSVGMTTTDGIYINGEATRKGDATGPRSARA